MPRWKGSSATVSAKYERTKRTYSLKGKSCEHADCGKAATHRHHRDEDVGNNRPENIAFLCHRHHLQHHWLIPPGPCKHCGRVGKLTKRGDCRTCYAYELRTGRVRPWAKDGRREGASRGVKKPALEKPPVACSNCGEQTKPSWRGRCRRCYDHWRLHGQTERST